MFSKKSLQISWNDFTVSLRPLEVIWANDYFFREKKYFQKKSLQISWKWFSRFPKATWSDLDELLLIFRQFPKQISDLPHTDLIDSSRTTETIWTNHCFFRGKQKFKIKVSDSLYNKFPASSLSIQPIWANDSLFWEKKIRKKFQNFLKWFPWLSWALWSDLGKRFFI